MLPLSARVAHPCFPESKPQGRCQRSGATGAVGQVRFNRPLCRPEGKYCDSIAECLPNPWQPYPWTLLIFSFTQLAACLAGSWRTGAHSAWKVKHSNGWLSFVQVCASGFSLQARPWCSSITPKLPADYLANQIEWPQLLPAPANRLPRWMSFSSVLAFVK